MKGSIAEVVATAPLYRDLAPDEIAELAAGLELRRFAPGEALMVQGADSDGAYVIASGAVDVAARLPGGGEAAIAELGPGDMVGEMALLMRGGRRTATARARGEVEALFTDRRYFEAALHLLRPASLKVLRRLGLTIAERLRAIRARSRTLVEAAPDDGLFRPLPGGEAHPPTDFDVRAFLPILPCLRDLSAGEVDALFAAARIERPSRGAALSEEGQAVDAPRLVVRGALLLGQRHGERLCQLDILGPGRFAGVAPVLEGAPAGAAIIVAEDSTVLAFDAARFTALWSGSDRLSLRLLEAVIGDLVVSLNTASNHLTRLNAQARVRAF
ncbi:MAG TPA: cyclic nucleotide-binding domain-containing protein [Caulobacteraceae bacterium]|nr:cyclic nucleotide-binding domain-containing protein [Caulobacteraceae bacterium]